MPCFSVEPLLIAVREEVPLISTGIFIVMAFTWGWLSDAIRGARWPFIYLGAVIHVRISTRLMTAKRPYNC